MSENLHDASSQSAPRPAEQRFETLENMYLASYMAYHNAKTMNPSLRRLAIEPDGDNLKLIAPGNMTLGFNHWSFGQLANRCGAPAPFLRDLPTDLAADCLNFKLRQSAEDDKSQIYFDHTTNCMRAVTSQKYGRVPNHEVIKALMDLPGGWVTPPARPVSGSTVGCRPATEADIAKCGGRTRVQVGEIIDPKSGLYASDRNMFAFLIDGKSHIDDGSDGGMARGFFVSNSEVGDCTFDLTSFYFREVCSNHIVWDVKDVVKIKIKHLGVRTRTRAFDGLRQELKAYSEASAQNEEALIRVARSKELGANRDDIVELLFEKKKILGKKMANLVYDTAEMNAGTDGSPRSVYGIVNGITRVSQNSKWMDERMELDQAAGKVMAMVS